MAEVLYWISTFVLILTLLCLLGYQGFKLRSQLQLQPQMHGYEAAIAVAMPMQLILLVDLEFDYINPYDSTSRVNNVVLPEFIILGIFCFTNLIAGHWFTFFLSLPCMYYNARLYIKREHLADVTEIYNKLKWEKKKRLLKVANLVIIFVFSILRGYALSGGLPSMPALIQFLEMSKMLQSESLRHSKLLWANPSSELSSMDNNHGESHPRRAELLREGTCDNPQRKRSLGRCDTLSEVLDSFCELEYFRQNRSS